MARRTGKPSVMIVEDQEALQALLAYNLKSAGFEVSVIGDGEEALAEAKLAPPDAMLLDWNLPNLSGLQICKAARKDKVLRQLAILMVTARDGEADVLQALEAGADDYITKPFSVVQLVARLRAVLRRALPDQASAVIEINTLRLDPTAVMVHHQGRRLKLSPTEFRLLNRLMSKAGNVQSRDALLARVWGQESEADVRTVDVHIRRLRKQLTKKGEADPIRTVRGEGYLIDTA